jgi:hypothetical protein
VSGEVFDKMIATNEFPRRSAEIWDNLDHLSEVALLGRETPRRPLPDTNFTRDGNKLTFARPMLFSDVGAGQSVYIPNEKEPTKMADDSNKSKENSGNDEEIASLKEAVAALTAKVDSLCDAKAENAAEDAAEEKVEASREGDPEMFSLRSNNARLSAEVKALKDAMSRAEFERQIDAMAADGYRIPDEERPGLVASLTASADPSKTLASWRSLFARDPVGVRIDMSRAQHAGSGSITADDVRSMVSAFAGKPEEFRRAVAEKLK